MRRKFLFFVVLLIISPTIAGNVNLRDVTANEWREDIAFLERTLVKQHPDAFNKVYQEEFNRALQKLQTGLESLQWYEIYTSLTALVAMIGDGHTVIYPDTKLRAFPVYPYAFNNGIYIIATDENNRELLNSRLVGVDELDVKELLDVLRPVVSHDNEWGFISALPNYFTRVEIMKALNLTGEEDSLKLKLDKDGEIFERIVLPAEGDFQWVQERAQETFRSQTNDNYWYELYPDSKLLHFHYDRCKSQEGKPFIFFTCEMFSYMRRQSAEKLLLDLRYNGGGNSLILEFFMLRVLLDCKYNREGRLFVAIGRETFSSAILNAISMKKRTRAIFLGEPTGGSPRHYGAPRSFTLPNSGIIVHCSTTFWRTTFDTSEAMLPDVLIERSFEDYYYMRDPVVEYIESLPIPE